MMHINWPLLGICFGTSIGVYLTWILFFKITGQDWYSLGGLLIGSTTFWTFGTGIVRSVTPWTLPLCWIAGLPVAYAAYAAVVYIVDFVCEMWDKWKAFRGTKHKPPAHH